MKRIKKILIDASLTGGRGPAKQAYEFITACQEKNVPYLFLTNKSFTRKLKELGLKADYIIEAELSDPKEEIYQKYFEAMKNIDFDLLVKFGARTASTYTAYQLKKPFIVVDGGLPDKLETYTSLYAREGYTKALKYILTTNFFWKYPPSLEMDNIVLATYPFSKKTLDFTRKLRKFDKKELIKKIKNFVPEVATKKYDLLINLVITGDYAASPADRKTYGAWLKTTEFDQVVGFIRRFITDLGIQYQGKVLVYMDPLLYPVVEDLFKTYKNVSGCYSKKGWNYDLEILMSRLADILVSRATNYVPNIAMMGQGGLVTTPVPVNYMDEDTAGNQAYALGLTGLINYDDEDYMKKFLKFAQDKKTQLEISNNLIKVSDKMVAEANSVDIILEEYKKL